MFGFKLILTPKRKQLLFLYEAALPVLAVISLFTLVALGTYYFHPWEQPLSILILNHAIWLVFAVDFVVRLCFAESFRKFIYEHLADFIAIIPVTPFIFLNYVFEVFKLDWSSSMLIESVFLIKFLAYLGRVYGTQRRFFKTNPFHYATGVMIVSIVIAAMLFSNFEKVSYGTALWFSIVTASTTGYGDIVPHTTAGYYIAVFLMVVGVACVTAFTSFLAGRIISKPKTKQSSPHLAAIESQLQRFTELTEDEVEEICLILRSLKHHQKVDLSDIKAKIAQRDAAKSPDNDEKIWHNMAFVKFVKRHFSDIMKDDEEVQSYQMLKLDSESDEPISVVAPAAGAQGTHGEAHGDAASVPQQGATEKDGAQNADGGASK